MHRLRAPMRIFGTKSTIGGRLPRRSKEFWRSRWAAAIYQAWSIKRLQPASFRLSINNPRPTRNDVGKPEPDELKKCKAMDRRSRGCCRGWRDLGLYGTAAAARRPL